MCLVDRLFADYAAYHRTPGNRACHRVGIPLIVIALLGGLARMALPPLGPLRPDGAHALIVASTGFYLVLERRLAMLMLPLGIGAYLVGRRAGLPSLATLFILGWGFQLVGHTLFERRQPAFMRNLVHVLVGPLWVLNESVRIVSEAPGEAQPSSSGSTPWETASR